VWQIRSWIKAIQAFKAAEAARHATN